MRKSRKKSVIEARGQKEPIHYASHMTFAAIWTACGQGMQAGSKWHKDVNMWGRTGIVKTEGWKLLSVDPELVTCAKCKRRLRTCSKPKQPSGNGES